MHGCIDASRGLSFVWGDHGTGSGAGEERVSAKVQSLYGTVIPRHPTRRGRCLSKTKNDRRLIGLIDEQKVKSPIRPLKERKGKTRGKKQERVNESETTSMV